MWVLTVRTSLPNVSKSKTDLKLTAEVFESFESAKAKLRTTLNKLAFTDNAMFDGKGYLKLFSSYIAFEEACLEDEDLDNDETFDSDVISIGFLKALHESLHSIFSGATTKLPFVEQKYDDMFLCANIANGGVLLEGDGEGPCNGVNPHIDTNMFDMTEAKDYHLHIDDYFGDRGEQECSSELYIDLVEAQFNK